MCSLSGNVVTFLATGGCSVTASQGGNSAHHAAPSVTRAFTITASFTVEPTSIAAAQPAGGTTVTVTSTPAGATWTGSSNADWLTVTPADADAATAAALAWTANLGTDARTGTATIAGHGVTVTQAGCAASATPASLVVAAGGATGTIDLSIGLACAWTAASDQPWLTVLPANGIGPASVTYQIAAHAGASDRSATLTIGGQPVTVTQQGTTPTTPGAPGAPSGLVASVVDHRVTIAWQPPATGAAPTGYVIEIGTQAGSANLGSVETSLATSFVNDNVPDGRYYLRVRARNGAGAGPVSNEVEVTVGFVAPPGPPGPTPPGPGPAPPGPPAPPSMPAAPARLTGTIGDGVLTLLWSAGTGGGDVIGHRIEVGTAPGLADIGTAPAGPSRTWQFAGVPPGRYFFRVRATNGGFVSPPSNELELTYGLAGSPQQLTARFEGPMVILNWLAPADTTVLGYVLEVGTAPGATNLLAVPLSAAQTGFVHDPVPAGIAFYVRVRALTPVGLGPPSNEVVVQR